MKTNPPSDKKKSKELEDLKITKAQEPLLADDPLWETLGSASQQMADPFFARNVVRETRQMEDQKPSFRRRAARALGWKTAAIPSAIAACLAAFVIVQVTNKPAQIDDKPDMAQMPETVEKMDLNDASDAMLDIVINESLAAAAEDPSLFTRDEIITLISL